MATVKELEEQLLSRDSETVLKAVKIVSNLALESERSNTLVSNSNDLLVALLLLVDAGNASLSTAAINAVMDLGITSLARQALVQCGLGNHLMSLLRWLADALANSPRNRALEELLELSLLTFERMLLHHLEDVPETFSFDVVYRKVKYIWSRRRTDLTDEAITSVAVFLARLGMEELVVHEKLSQQEVGTPTFIDFSDHFLEKHWESSVRLTEALPEFVEQVFPVGQDPLELLRALVDTTVSCPLISNDELLPSHVFEEMQEALGDGVKYDVDVRMVRCSASNSEEEHYVINSAERLVKTEEVVRAFQSGYTVAVRGMEFRSPVLAAVCERLGVEAGQATVGVNLYMTPPNSQGLTLHYDDHCVFVLQVAGEKRWSIYPPEDVLPRLYQRRRISQPAGTPMDVVLSEGDLLYIPRGFPHRAVAAGGKRKRGEGEGNSLGYGCCMLREKLTPSKVKGFSLHLTFGVEVDSPFTWEGFVQMAVHSWALLHWRSETDEERAAEAVLHFAVRSAGDKEPSFRKACLVAMPSSDESANLKTFTRLIEALEPNASFDGACKVMRRESECLSWLRHVRKERSDEFDIAPGLLETEGIRKTFTVIKLQFVKQAVLEKEVYDKARNDKISSH